MAYQLLVNKLLNKFNICDDVKDGIIRNVMTDNMTIKYNEVIKQINKSPVTHSRKSFINVLNVIIKVHGRSWYLWGSRGNRLKGCEGYQSGQGSLYASPSCEACGYGRYIHMYHASYINRGNSRSIWIPRLVKVGY